ncbi:MAG: bifunctional shikimate kinase/3-dehydroquinate synthase [Deltaproteobacteria bacterium]
MIVVGGPPGVGKTTVARHAALRWGSVAIDLDTQLEERLGRTVATLIRESGEDAFRDAERDALGSVDPSRAAVLALGGGTLVRPESARAARRLGPVVGLVASPEVLDRRVSADATDRPLQRPSSELLDKRREAYASVDFDVAAEDDADVVAANVEARTKDTVTLECPVGDVQTRVIVGRNLIDAVRGAVAVQRPTRPVVVVLDAKVPAARRSAIVAGIEALYPVVTIEVEGGEAVKTWSVLEDVTERALAAGAGRQSVVVGVGGGATTDLAGLVASMLGRGAALVLVPTTVLSQVDAAVGGKCAINSRSGRNLIGAFHAAQDVVVDLDALPSLDPAEMRNGLAEMLKMGILADASLFDRIVEAGAPDVASIARSIELKAQIVASDPYERGARKTLNLGHTLAHALETASDHTLRHGEAVAIGLCAAARYSAALGLAHPDVVARIEAGIARVGLPTHSPEGLDDRAAAALGHDKKSGSTQIDFVAIRTLEEVQLVALSLEEVRRELIRHGGRS